MTTTAPVALSDTAWNEVANGAAGPDCVLSAPISFSVIWHVGPADPGPSSLVGHPLTGTAYLPPLGATDKVYARSVAGLATVTVSKS